jgi:hypothetical protein
MKLASEKVKQRLAARHGTPWLTLQLEERVKLNVASTRARRPRSKAAHFQA